uniref:Fiber protein Fb34 n=1 Tax=Populus davidiana TaxID=266767 RepID=A0A6M2F4Y9_9ROSI
MRTIHTPQDGINMFGRPLICSFLPLAAEQSIFSEVTNIQYLALQATVQPDAEKNYSYCIYDSDIATGFGVGAFLFLMASQVLIMFASKCFCCGKPLSPGGSRAWAVILFITCWVFFFIAEICLLAGSVRNAYHTRYRNIFDETLDCPSLRKGVFGAGAAFTLFTAIVADLYYVCYSKARGSFQPYGGDAGVGMGTYK